HLRLRFPLRHLARPPLLLRHEKMRRLHRRQRTPLAREKNPPRRKNRRPQTRPRRQTRCLSHHHNVPKRLPSRWTKRAVRRGSIARDQGGAHCPQRAGSRCIDPMCPTRCARRGGVSALKATRSTDRGADRFSVTPPGAARKTVV